MTTVKLPIINIITRTSNRPIYFSECQQSIQIQTHPGELIKRLVTFDDENDLNLYIQKHNGLVAMEVDREPRKNPNHFPYHAYLNTVIKHIEEFGSGWIMILDDDNLLSKPESLEIISRKIIEDGDDPNKFYIWKCQNGDRVVPSEHTFGKVPKAGDLHISCFAFHYKQAKLVNFDTKKGSEAEVISKLYSQLNCVWIDDILTQTLGSNNATREDKKMASQPQIVSPVIDNKKKLLLKTLSGSPDKLPTSPLVAPPNKSHEDEEEEIIEHIIPKKINIEMSAVNDKLSTIAEKKSNANHNDEDMDYGEDDEDEEVIGNEEINGNDSDEEEIINQEHVEPEPELKPFIKAELATPISKSVENHTIRLSGGSAPQTPYVLNEINLSPNTTSQETNQLLVKLINLLERKNGKRIYILDEDNMRKLSTCIMDALTCTDLEDRLFKVLENNTLSKRKVELNEKLNQSIANHDSISVDVSSKVPTHTQSKVRSHVASVATVSVSENKSQLASLLNNYNQSSIINNDSNNQFIDKIYIITNDQSAKNVALERNKKILVKSGYEYNILMVKDMTLYHYQNGIKEAIKDAKANNYEKVTILNGNALLNNKFCEIYKKQINKISKMKDNCNLWFLGNTKEVSFKEILNTRFDVEDYLLLYDDIVEAKFTTEEKAKTHWKTYGHREARYGAIEVSNGAAQPIIANHGFVVSCELYDKLLDLLNKQVMRDTKNVLIDLQNGLEISTVWTCKPDAIVPQFGNAGNHGKNSQLSIKNGWYYNHFK